ncbi:MAG: chemotaxis response regulator protein-glutamate methylesterase [Acidobacteria bacterium]|nr:chemotaxis response regulator protein-glutamate methylesterase [Acidobacteriota bacterium]
MNPVRVLVVDDSALMRKLIPQMLERDGSIQVVGTAVDGAFGLQRVAELKPDVVTLDLEMPHMDGLAMLRELMRKHRLPVIVVSAHTREGASMTMKALGFGAFDFIAKPQDGSTHIEEIAAELVRKIKVAAQSGVGRALQLPFDFAATPPRRAKVAQASAPSKVVAIGISTGGPNTLQYLLSQLPADFPACILIVQHMPEGFTEMLARRLDEHCAISVREARSGDALSAGTALICPGNRHLRLIRRADGSLGLALSSEPAVNGHRPSVSVLFQSVAHEAGRNSIAVLMTGMGDDGAEALGSVKAAGGLTIAQDAESCVVFGMPRAAIEKGNAMRVISLDALANTLQVQCGRQNPVSALRHDPVLDPVEVRPE